MSKREYLINYILSMTPEQTRKLLNHPEVIKMMEECRAQTTNAQTTTSH